MRGPVDLSRELLTAEVVHEIVHLRRRIDDAVELPDVLDVPAASCLTVRMYDAGATPVAALLPAGRIAATTAVARALGARSAAPIDATRVSALTDYHPSLVAPIGLPRTVRVLADVAVGEPEVVFTATGDGSTALKIRSADLLGLCRATLAPLVEPGAVPVQAWAGEDAWRGVPIATAYR